MTNDTTDWATFVAKLAEGDRATLVERRRTGHIPEPLYERLGNAGHLGFSWTPVDSQDRPVGETTYWMPVGLREHLRAEHGE